MIETVLEAAALAIVPGIILAAWLARNSPENRASAAIATARAAAITARWSALARAYAGSRSIIITRSVETVETVSATPC